MKDFKNCASGIDDFFTMSIFTDIILARVGHTIGFGFSEEVN
jgi:hypothetical protein